MKSKPICRFYRVQTDFIKSLDSSVTHSMPEYVHFCSKIRCTGVENVQKCVANMNFFPFFII